MPHTRSQLVHVTSDLPPTWEQGNFLVAESEHGAQEEATSAAVFCGLAAMEQKGRKWPTLIDLSSLSPLGALSSVRGETSSRSPHLFVLPIADENMLSRPEAGEAARFAKDSGSAVVFRLAEPLSDSAILDNLAVTALVRQERDRTRFVTSSVPLSQVNPLERGGVLRRLWSWLLERVAACLR